jgi:hypothetical protein
MNLHKSVLESHFFLRTLYVLFYVPICIILCTYMYYFMYLCVLFYVPICIILTNKRAGLNFGRFSTNLSGQPGCDHTKVRVPQAGWPDWANFRQIGGCFLWTGYFKITQLAQMYWLLFTTVKSVLLILTKNELGYILGDFFTNSSGHPDHKRQLHRASLGTLQLEPFSLSYRQGDQISLWKKSPKM